MSTTGDTSAQPIEKIKFSYLIFSIRRLLPNTGEQYPPHFGLFHGRLQALPLPIKIISKYNFHFFLAALLSLSAAFCLRDST
jgi:hypothetical protein